MPLIFESLVIHITSCGVRVIRDPSPHSVHSGTSVTMTGHFQADIAQYHLKTAISISHVKTWQVWCHDKAAGFSIASVFKDLD
jgi:hypothetical protein